MSAAYIDLGSAAAGATFSPCGQYRYRLWRRWQNKGNTVLWIMLNPSTADHEVLDPTVTRCLHYSRQWRFAALAVCNLFAYRATYPRQLLAACDPVGVENNRYIRQACVDADKIILAWGNHGVHSGRADFLRKQLPVWSYPKKLYALSVNRSGEPAHPLYLPKHLKPRLYRTV